MNIVHLSGKYRIRKLTPDDANIIVDALKNHDLFYKYHPPVITVQTILEDMEALPPGKGPEDKFYFGFFQNDTLIAVMDLIVGYPDPGTVFIGFFAMNTEFQKKGIGSVIISDCVRYLRKEGFQKIRLGIDKGNPQSKAFWTKNKFVLTGEERPEEAPVYEMMEREL